MSSADASGPVPAMDKFYPLFAWLCCATSFPLLLIERPRKRLDPVRLVPGHPGDWYHWFKNYGVENYGWDAQWWCKFSSFVMLAQTVVICVLSLAVLF